MLKSIHECMEEILERADNQKKLITKPLESTSQDNELISFILPLHPKNIRAIPNVVLRGALFGVVGKGNRKYEQGIVKSTINGITVKFTGQQLDQADLDVWQECLRLNQGVSIGEKIYFSAKVFLFNLGRNNGKSDRDWLYSSLLRLMSSVVELGDGRFFYAGQLIQSWERDEKSGKNSIILNEKFMPFFQEKLWTGLSIEERFLLKGKPLAQWLHGFYSTHEKPFGYKVETLLKLCGSEVSFLWKFRQTLKKSLDSLSKITGWKCIIDENDIVKIVRIIKN